MPKSFVVWIRKYGSTLFVFVGLAIVGLTVTQVQTQQRISTKAAGDPANQADEIGFLIDPQTIQVDNTGLGKTRVRLESLDQTIVHARLALKYRPDQVENINIRPGSAFAEVENQIGGGQLVIISNGNFFGTGTWVKLQVKLRPGVNNAELAVVPELSSLRYEEGTTRNIGELKIKIIR